MLQLLFCLPIAMWTGGVSRPTLCTSPKLVQTSYAPISDFEIDSFDPATGLLKGSFGIKGPWTGTDNYDWGDFGFPKIFVEDGPDFEVDGTWNGADIVQQPKYNGNAAEPRATFSLHVPTGSKSGQVMVLLKGFRTKADGTSAADTQTVFAVAEYPNTLAGQGQGTRPGTTVPITLEPMYIASTRFSCLDPGSIQDFFLIPESFVNWGQLAYSKPKFYEISDAEAPEPGSNWAKMHVDSLNANGTNDKEIDFIAKPNNLKGYYMIVLKEVVDYNGVRSIERNGVIRAFDRTIGGAAADALTTLVSANTSQPGSVTTTSSGGGTGSTAQPSAGATLAAPGASQLILVCQVGRGMPTICSTLTASPPAGFKVICFSNWADLLPQLRDYEITSTSPLAGTISTIEVVAHGTPKTCGTFEVKPNPSDLSSFGAWLSTNVAASTQVYLSACNTGPCTSSCISQQLSNRAACKVFGSKGYVADYVANSTISASPDDWGRPGAATYPCAVPTIVHGASNCFVDKSATRNNAQYTSSLSSVTVYDITDLSAVLQSRAKAVVSSTLAAGHIVRRPLNNRVGPDLQISMNGRLFQFLYGGQYMRASALGGLGINGFAVVYRVPSSAGLTSLKAAWSLTQVN